MDYKLLGEGAMVNQRSYDKLAEVEAIIFDCDGTLIDSTESYYLADRIVACIILEKLYGLKCSLGRDVNDVLERLEMLGGFNNDWYKTGLITQSIIMKVDEPVERIADDIAEIDDVNAYLERCMVEVSSPDYVLNGLRWISEKASQAYGSIMWLRDFEKLIDTEAERLGRLMRIQELRGLLGPLTRYGSGLLTTLYDEVYLGLEGVRERYGVEPRYVSWEGLLENEKPLIMEEVLEKLSEGVPKGIAIATGRGRWETEKGLGELIYYFDLEASVFAADLPNRYEKPNPWILIECSKRLGAEKVMYVGNSLEDLLLVENARGNGLDALFTGILTNPYALEIFIRKGADAIIDDVNLLPRLIERGEVFWKPF
jgi:phosphoglycolate phosphatase-like HAD superfamily hydrolase